MKRTEISALYKSPESFADQTITVAGWARSIRASNVFGFLTIFLLLSHFQTRL